jgi:hypothetical protein
MPVVTWSGLNISPGKYLVQLVYGTPHSGSVEITIGDNALFVPVETTGNWGRFIKFDAGSVEVKNPRADVQVTTKEIVGDALMDLKTIVLVPESKQ